MVVRFTAAAGLAAAILSTLFAGPAAAQSGSAKGTVMSPDRTTVKARVSPGGAVEAKVKHGTRLRITCQMSGPIASSKGSRSNIWNRVIVGTKRLYMSDVLMKTGSSGVLVAKLCGAPALDPQQLPGDTTGACGITSPVAQLPPFPSRSAFIKAAVPGAQKSDRETQVPASVTLAQSILETGSGTIAAGANNYFGIKAGVVADEGEGVFQWGVNGVGCVLRKTGEVIGGKMVTTIGAFRAYASLAKSIEDHGARLVANDVYKGAFAYTEKPEQFARVIARYYATDPEYANKVVSLMRSEKLTRYDVKGKKVAPVPADDTPATTTPTTPAKPAVPTPADPSGGVSPSP
ncbi:endolysin [Paraconexibacter sp. AEG42_29]|uniref:Endolysin n=1 Tax=Paraconexibacter sp. AEG42_29 TaxID=2997339 RepID=A0AAU7B3P8_9ACTN